MLAAGKHFPGLGAATRSQDTDNLPVTLDVPAATPRAEDELPYRAAIAAGLRMVMLSWAVYPALDPARPACRRWWSRASCASGSDSPGSPSPMRWRPARCWPFGSISERAQLAALAGDDLLLCAGRQVGQGRQALAALASGYADGQLSRQAAAAAVARTWRCAPPSPADPGLPESLRSGELAAS